MDSRVSNVSHVVLGFRKCFFVFVNLLAGFIFYDYDFMNREAVIDCVGELGEEGTGVVFDACMRTRGGHGGFEHS